MEGHNWFLNQFFENPRRSIKNRFKLPALEFTVYVQNHKFSPEAQVLDEPDSAKPAQRSSYTGPPGYIGWTQFQRM
jgi:hypothetical protein